MDCRSEPEKNLHLPLDFRTELEPNLDCGIELEPNLELPLDLKRNRN